MPLDSRDRSNFKGTQNLFDTVRLSKDVFNKTTPVYSARIADNTAEVEIIKNTPVDQQAIFNDWLKISINSSGNFPAIPAETTAWRYDTDSGRFSNTTNSASFIGAVSDRQYSDYALEVKISSTATDDDTIGILIAFHQDPTTGRQYTLSLNRSPGGNTPLYGIVYNMSQGGSNQWNAVVGNDKVTWGNGAAGNLTSAQAGYASNTPGVNWNNKPALILRVERKGDIITTHTSDWATPNTVNDSTKLTLDLNSDPRLAVFKGAKSYGYCALSQANSYWDIVKFTNPQGVIYDMSNGSIWEYDGTNWVRAYDFEYRPKNGSIMTDTDTGKLAVACTFQKYATITTTVVPRK